MGGLLGMVAMVRNDPTVAEWVSYHHAAGLHEFLFIDDGSDDGTWERLQYMALVAPWVKCVRYDGKAESRRHPSDKEVIARQVDAYRQAREMIPAAWAWAAFMDLDEYLVTRDNRPLGKLLELADEVSAVALNWKCFGTPTQAHGFVIERTTRCSSSKSRFNLHYKCLVRNGRIGPAMSTHRPNITEGKIVHDFDGAYEGRKHGKTTSIRHGQAWINHYRCGSLTTWLKRQARGYDGWEDYASLEEFRRRVKECNLETDETSLAHVPRMKRLMDALEPGWIERTG